MNNINLLPGNLSSSKPLLAILFKVKLFNVIAVIIYGIFMAVVVMISITNSAAITFSQKRTAELKNKLQSLSQVEKQYFFLKYKTGNIKNILAKDTSLPSVQNFEQVYSEALSSADLKAASFVQNNTTIEVIFRDADTLKYFLDAVKSKAEYEQILLDNVSYKPGFGYSIFIKLGKGKIK